jgi:hypothetical protein
MQPLFTPVTPLISTANPKASKTVGEKHQERQEQRYRLHLY